MASVQLIRVDAEGLNRFPARLSKVDQALIRETTKELRGYGKSLVEYARREAPVREGKLVQSIRFQVTNPDTRNVSLQLLAGNAARPEVVVKSVLFGSKPHDIYPKRKGGFLVFRAGLRGIRSAKVGGKGRGGDLIFVRHVHHPGTKPNNFIERAFNETQFILDKLLKRIGKLSVDVIQE